jgi:hypothetical protein
MGNKKLRQNGFFEQVSLEKTEMAVGVFGDRCFMRFKYFLLMQQNHRNSKYGNHQTDNI